MMKKFNCAKLKQLKRILAFSCVLFGYLFCFFVLMKKKLNQTLKIPPNCSGLGSTNREREWIAHGRLTGRPSAGSRQFCLASAVLSLSLIKLMLRNFIFLFACRFSTNFVFSSISNKAKEKKVENSSKQHEIKRTKKTVEKRWIKEKMLQSSRHTSHDSMLKKSLSCH